MPDQQRHRNRYRAPSRAHEPRRGFTNPQAVDRTDEDIHVCPECSSDMVQPEEWAPVDMRRWRVALRCPECTWAEAGVYPQHVLDRFDAILDEGAATLMADLDALERHSMEEELRNFSSALQNDRILPEDF